MLLRRHRKPIKTNRQVEEIFIEDVESVKDELDKPSIEETLSKYTVPELKEMAKEREIKGYSNMKKDKLINALKG